MGLTKIKRGNEKDCGQDLAGRGYEQNACIFSSYFHYIFPLFLMWDDKERPQTPVTATQTYMSCIEVSFS